MNTRSVEHFQQSVADHDATSTVILPEELETTLSALIEPPAVGAELPFENLSLADTPVTLDPSPTQLRGATTGVTGSRIGIASLGTVAVESRTEGDEFVSLYPKNHVVIIKASNLRSDLGDAFGWIRSEFENDRQSLVLATGPSSTGDMGALVQGVHGPENVHIVIVRDNE